MAGKIKSRKEFSEYCLRKLGKPVIEINVSEDQVNDRIDEALKMYWKYHYDGKEKVYYVHQWTENDKENGFIQLPENIIGVIRNFPLSSAFNAGGVFSLQYQIVLQDLWRWSSVQLTNYYHIYQYTQLIEELLVGQQPVRFNENTNRVYLDVTSSRISPGNFVILESYRRLDPDETVLMYQEDSVVGTFQESETVTGGTSGATATLNSLNKQRTHEHFTTVTSNTSFQKGETITGGTSGATATLHLLHNQTTAYNDVWLQNYATTLIKEQWASNLGKYQGQLPGGLQFNADKMFMDAIREKEAHENDLINSFSMPAGDMIG